VEEPVEPSLSKMDVVLSFSLEVTVAQNLSKMEFILDSIS
jgi:hypothetical protein